MWEKGPGGDAQGSEGLERAVRAPEGAGVARGETLHTTRWGHRGFIRDTQCMGGMWVQADCTKRVPRAAGGGQAERRRAKPSPGVWTPLAVNREDGRASPARNRPESGESERTTANPHLKNPNSNTPLLFACLQSGSSPSQQPQPLRMALALCLSVSLFAGPHGPQWLCFVRKMSWACS